MFRRLARKGWRRFYDHFRLFSPLYEFSLHPFCTRNMASIRRQKSGRWRVQVRRKGQSVSETFVRYEDAKAWGVDAERQIDRGEVPRASQIARLATFGDLVELHIEDMKSVGRAPRRSKAAVLRALKQELGRKKIGEIDREEIVRFGRARAKAGAGPITVGMDIGMIKLVLSHAAAVHGLAVRVEPVNLGRQALTRLGLVGKSRERDRRPSDEELQRLFERFDRNDRVTIPMTRVIQFAIATAMRQEEIFRVVWDDYNPRTRMLTIRDRKDPRNKDGNDQRIPLLKLSGYDAVELVEAQRIVRTNSDPRIFPFNPRSAGTAFRRACVEEGIIDLHFHDMRHEGTSRLFEAGLQIHQVALVTGHKDWKMLRRYTHLRPESLHHLAGHLAA